MKNIWCEPLENMRGCHDDQEMTRQEKKNHAKQRSDGGMSSSDVGGKKSCSEQSVGKNGDEVKRMHRHSA
jgi:hypothetical protein